MCRTYLLQQWGQELRGQVAAKAFFWAKTFSFWVKPERKKIKTSHFVRESCGFGILGILDSLCLSHNQSSLFALFMCLFTRQLFFLSSKLRLRGSLLWGYHLHKDFSSLAHPLVDGIRIGDGAFVACRSFSSKVKEELSKRFGSSRSLSAGNRHPSNSLRS